MDGVELEKKTLAIDAVIHAGLLKSHIIESTISFG